MCVCVKQGNHVACCVINVTALSPHCRWCLVSRQSHRNTRPSTLTKMMVFLKQSLVGRRVHLEASSFIFPKHRWFSLKESISPLPYMQCVQIDSKRVPSSAASVSTLSGELQQKPQAGTVNASSAYIKQLPSANRPSRCS